MATFPDGYTAFERPGVLGRDGSISYEITVNQLGSTLEDPAEGGTAASFLLGAAIAESEAHTPGRLVWVDAVYFSVHDSQLVWLVFETTTSEAGEEIPITHARAYYARLGMDSFSIGGVRQSMYRAARLESRDMTIGVLKRAEAEGAIERSPVDTRAIQQRMATQRYEACAACRSHTGCRGNKDLHNGYSECPVEVGSCDHGFSDHHKTGVTCDYHKGCTGGGMVGDFDYRDYPLDAEPETVSGGDYSCGCWDTCNWCTCRHVPVSKPLDMPSLAAFVFEKTFRSGTAHPLASQGFWVDQATGRSSSPR